ncbi:MAG TPA: 23S rRNA (uracil(1939)-C(5))-methyltransferase RlmD [Clostridia bacterium]|nr:23S rRNA (uracil(1939)-C(5))-methyltransferase RlmD [Clostridia bacterium]
MEQRKAPPLKRNDDIVLTIDALGSEGQGIGRYEGFAVFVPGALKNETVHVHIIKVTSSYAVGKLTGIAVQSHDRAAPKCPLFSRCGGCSLQHMRYDAQLSFKRQVVYDALTRIGGFENISVNETIGMDHPWLYRNKGSFPYANVDETVQTGFFAPRSHRIVPLESCPIEHESAIAVALSVREWARRYSVPVYDEETHKGILRHAMVRIASDGSVMAVIVTTGSLPHEKALVSILQRDVPQLKSVVHNINNTDTNVILGKIYKTLWGSERIDHTLCGLTFEVSAASFLQVNTEQTEKLYKTALDLLDPQKSETVADIYCGIGTISLLLAKRAKRVIGVENVSEAVEDAKRNAQKNCIGNVEFLYGDAESVLPKLVANGVSFDAAVVDPPRKGCDEAALKSIREAGVSRLVYVSCNPATLARDCKQLTHLGYTISTVQPVDMFPQTEHVEVCVLLSKNLDK